jgi:16S rRNA (guanine(966)-N(2))-methyltransferase RsmD
MIRIIAGQAKGRRLQSPPGALSRPTAARVRQTLFDILAPRLTGCRFLDACAGSGGIGLEALSRGAARVVLIDEAAATVQSIKENASLLAGLGGDVLVLRQDARIALPALGARGHLFDVIYLDPPYASDLYEPLLEAVSSARLLAEDGVLVAERFKKRALPERMGGLSRVRSVRVGDHVLDFYAWT